MSRRVHTVFLALALLLITGTSCKSEFEKIRTSSQPELVLEKAYEYYDRGDYQKAQTLLELVITNYRGKREAEEIFYRYAYTFYYTRQYLLAAYYFENFSQTYGASPLREEADFMTAYSYYQLSPVFRLEQTYTDKAIDALQLFVNTYPDSDRVDESNHLIDEMREKLERKAFEEAQLYFDLRQYQSAIHVYENLLKDFPETGRAEEVRYMVIRSNYLLAENSILDRQLERFRETKTLAEEYLERYGTDSQFSRQVNSIWEDTQDKLNDLENV